MKINTKKLRKVLLELISDMDQITDQGRYGIGATIGNNRKYSISISVDTFDPEEAIAEKYNCIELDNVANNTDT